MHAVERILLIDDDADVRASLARVLARAGYEVVEAKNGREAVRLHESHPADLVVTDIFMPEQDGIETIRLMHRRHPEVRIVVISGGDASGSMNLMEQAKLFGARTTLQKPFEMNALLEAVRDALAAG